MVSGVPLNAVLSGGASTANLGLFGGRQRPNLVGDPNTSGSDNERVAFEGQDSARYFNASGIRESRSRHVRQCAARRRRRALSVPQEHRPGHRERHHVSVRHSAQVRFEILNLTNTAKFRGIDSNAITDQSFGRITQQAGFMRIWQLSFRYAF